MKAIKYLVIGAMIGISAPSMAQDVDYGTALAPVTQALKSKAANAGDLAKSYIKEFKKNPEAIIALGNSYLAVKDLVKADEMAELALTRTKKDLKNQANAYILKGAENMENFKPIIEQAKKLLASPYMRHFITIDIQSSLPNIKCPVLALNGKKTTTQTPKPNQRPSS